MTNCQGLNRNETAAKLAANFGFNESTVRGNLSRGSYGIRLGADGHSWQRLAGR